MLAKFGEGGAPAGGVQSYFQMNLEEWKEIVLNYQGKQVRGRYKVVGRLVIVISGPETKTAPLGVLPAERLAHVLLRQLVFEAQEKATSPNAP